MTKILVIDDEEVIVKGITDFLSAQGFKIIKAGDGEEGLRVARKEKPDLILLDVMMPKLDGFQVLAQLKERKETIDIPVIMLTVKSGSEDQLKGMQAYADKYLTKPFDLGQLHEEIKKSLAIRNKNHPS